MEQIGYLRKLKAKKIQRQFQIMNESMILIWGKAEKKSNSHKSNFFSIEMLSVQFFVILVLLCLMISIF